MKHQSQFLLLVVASAVVGALNPIAGAKTPVVVNETADINIALELKMLQQSYQTLSVADHDYKGHRKGAMNAIALTCKALGGNASGDGKGLEAQATSDAQLKAALQVVGGVRDAAQMARQPQIVAYLNTAVQELQTALSIK